VLDRNRPDAYKTRPLGAQVAQLVEQRIENPRVGGSNPPLGTTFRRKAAKSARRSAQREDGLSKSCRTGNLIAQRRKVPGKARSAKTGCQNPVEPPT
jgi:hypothetical protein